MNNKITAIVIAKNEESMISSCLETLKWCDEILLIDNDSSDLTVQKAERFGVKIVSFKSKSFAEIRTEALKKVTTPWLFYLDADERVTPDLAKKIKNTIENTEISAISIARKNIYYGKYFQYGGWQNDLVTRVFKKSDLQNWSGDIHESPNYSGKTTSISEPIIHLSHRNVIDGLYKTAEWTQIEARLLYKSNIKKVKLRTIFRKGLMEFLRRAFFKKGYKDGHEGFIEAIIQAINKILIYIQVWEMQQKPSLKNKYLEQEKNISKLWKSSQL
jgi:(heptosyl)LPS beta-1,4-glucosyltransferase